MSPTGRLVCFVGMERSDHQLHTARQGAAHRAHRPARGGARGIVFFGQPSRVPLQREWHQETRSCARCPALGLCNRHAARRDQAAAGRTCVLCEVGISSRQTKGSGPQPFAIPCCMRAFIMGLLLLLEVEQIASVAPEGLRIHGLLTRSGLPFLGFTRRFAVDVDARARELTGLALSRVLAVLGVEHQRTMGALWGRD